MLIREEIPEEGGNEDMSWRGTCGDRAQGRVACRRRGRAGWIGAACILVFPVDQCQLKSHRAVD